MRPLTDGIRDAIRLALLRIYPPALFKAQHYKLHRRFGSHTYLANLRSPRTFNEHILKRKLDPALPALGKRLVDKFEVKQFVRERVGDSYVIPTLALHDSATAAIGASYPRACVLKPTHLSGQVILLPMGAGELDRSHHDLVRTWFRTNHYLRSGEPQYKDLPPRAIVEPLIGDGTEPPPDYKIFCWGGSPHFIQVDTNRFQGHQRSFFDLQWRPMEMTLRYPLCDIPPARPAKLSEMLEIARALSEGLDFVRVDLYCTPDNVYFGELTFHPDSGNAPFNDYATDLAVGRYFDSA